MSSLTQAHCYQGATSDQQATKRKYNILWVPDPTRALNTAPTGAIFHEWIDVAVSDGRSLVGNPNLQGFIFPQPNYNDHEATQLTYIHEKVRNKMNIIAKQH